MTFFVIFLFVSEQETGIAVLYVFYCHIWNVFVAAERVKEVVVDVMCYVFIWFISLCSCCKYDFCFVDVNTRVTLLFLN